MFLEHFKLREQPFGVTPDPRYLFPSPGHGEALASLIYGIESDLGFGAVIAEPGMGKTTLLFHLLERYRQSARTAFIFNTQCNSGDLLQALLGELDDQPGPCETFQLHQRFKQILLAAADARQRVILVIDEAQNLSDAVMETVRLLSNFESASRKLLHIVLAGQPELATRLARPELSQLRQRIAILSSLPPLSARETTDYIEHRLRVAGYRGKSLFAPGPLAQISGLSWGVPREINRLCFNSLSLAYASGRDEIDSSIIEEVAADLDLRPRLRNNGESQQLQQVRSATAVQSIARPTAAPLTALGDKSVDGVNRQPLQARAIMRTAPQPPSRSTAVRLNQTSAARNKVISKSHLLPYRWPIRWNPFRWGSFTWPW